jgi:hypothetical protein
MQNQALMAILTYREVDLTISDLRQKPKARKYEPFKATCRPLR